MATRLMALCNDEVNACLLLLERVLGLADQRAEFHARRVRLFHQPRRRCTDGCDQELDAGELKRHLEQFLGVLGRALFAAQHFL